MVVGASAAPGLQVAFQACGLPPGISASFAPDPSESVPDGTSPLAGSASSTLTVSRTGSIEPGTYPLAIEAYAADTSGGPTSNTGYINPRGVLVTIGSTGILALSRLSAIPLVNYDACTPLPAGFKPPLTPTPLPANVSLKAWVTDDHPAQGQPVELHAQIQNNGQPVAGQFMKSNWYRPDGIRVCDAITDPNGVASCSLPNDNPRTGYPVYIQITFTYQGTDYTAYTVYFM